MTYPKTFTFSERWARMLLAAWNSGNLAALQTALDQVASTGNVLPHAQKERFDLVQETARTIRLWLRGGRWRNQDDLQASLVLLRHLAGCESESWKAARTEPKAEESVKARRSSPAMSVQFGLDLAN